MLRKLMKSAVFRHQVAATRRCNALAGRLVRSICSAPPPHTFTSPSELTQLMRLAYSVPTEGCMLEIGSYLGASARYLGVAAAERGMDLYCVDTWKNETMPDGIRDTEREFLANTKGVDARIKMVKKPSQYLTASDVPQRVCLAFIDGDHSYEGCLADWNFVRTVMHPAGIVAFHDTNTFAGVSAVVGEILQTKQWAIGGMTDTLLWIRRSDWTTPLPTKAV